MSIPLKPPTSFKLNYIHSPFYANHLYLMGAFNNNLLSYSNDIIPTRVFTLYELEHFYNGKNNTPSYLSANGLVFDVTHNLPWLNHFHTNIIPGYDYSSLFPFPQNTTFKDLSLHQNITFKDLSLHAPIVGRMIYD